MINVDDYKRLLNESMDTLVVTDSENRELGGFERAAQLITDKAQRCKSLGGYVIFIGNGGSAAICNHCIIDWWKCGGIPTRNFYGDSQLTCLGNDFGFEYIFSKQIEGLAKSEDLLVAISSSGKSADILNGVKVAKEKNIPVITLSGFDPKNPLRSMGDINVYVPSERYGFVEIIHGIVLHAVCDMLQ